MPEWFQVCKDCRGFIPDNPCSFGQVRCAMGKKILALGLAGLLLFAFNPAYAEKGDAEYHTRIAQLNQGIKDAHHSFIMQKDEARKDALEQLGKLGNTKEDLASRKAIMAGTKKQVEALREKYNTTKTMLLEREKTLRDARSQEKAPVAKTNPVKEKARY